MAVNLKDNFPIMLLITSILLILLIVVFNSRQNHFSSSEQFPTPIQNIQLGSLDENLIVSRQLSDYDLLSNENIMQPP